MCLSTVYAHTAYPRPGILWHWPAIPAMRLLWTIMTPLGEPVEPLVYITIARSEGRGGSTAIFTYGHRNQRGDGQEQAKDSSAFNFISNVSLNLLRCLPMSSQWDMRYLALWHSDEYRVRYKLNEFFLLLLLLTVFRYGSQVCDWLHALDHKRLRVASSTHILTVHIDDMGQSRDTGQDALT